MLAVRRMRMFALKPKTKNHEDSWLTLIGGHNYWHICEHFSTQKLSIMFLSLNSNKLSIVH